METLVSRSYLSRRDSNPRRGFGSWWLNRRASVLECASPLALSIRMPSPGTLLLVLLALFFGLPMPTPSAAADLKTKKLIEFGWDEPGTGFLRTNIAQMQRTPFDGCVFHADYRTTTDAKGSFTWESWGSRAFTRADVQEAFADLRATRFGKFNQNFLRFNTTPAKLDWFDDYSAVLTNATLAAELARTGRCPGLLFDIEQYEGPLFNYRKQRDAKTKSWDLYAAQVRKRGSEVMQAFQKGYPGLTVFLTFGYSLPWLESYQGKGPLADCNYGLLAPFLDGMIASARGKTRLVDGHEISYAYQTAAQFVAARKAMSQDLLPIVRDPEKYRQVVSLGFGIWLDNDWRKRGWDTNDFSRNYFSPDTFETSVREALQTADEYVWIYSESPRWWSDAGTPKALPEPYAVALRRARNGQAPGK